MKFQELSPVFDFNIGIILTKSEFDNFGEKTEFQKLYVVKGFHEGHAHYFQSKFLKGGPTDGSNPKPVEMPSSSVS